MNATFLARMRRIGTTRSGRVGAILALMMVGYALLAGVVAPWWGRTQAERRLSALVGGTVAIESVRFQPFSWRLQIDGFRLSESDGTPVLGFRRLLVDAEVSSLWKRELCLSAVELEGWQLRVSRATNGAVNLAELAARVTAHLPTNTPPQKNPEEAGLAPVTVQRWLVSQGRVDVDDRFPAGGFRLQLDPIDASGTNLSTRAGQASVLGFAARGDGGETLEFAGQVRVAESILEGVFRAKRLGLVRARPYSDAVAHIAVTNGWVDLEVPFRVGWGASGLEASVRDMSVTLEDVAAVERGTGEPFAGAARVELGSIQASLAEKRVDVGGLRIRGPWLEARRRPGAGEGGETNLRGIVEPEVIDELISGLTDWKLALDRIEVEAGAVRYTDRVVRPPVEARVEELQLRADHLSNGTNAPPLTVQAGLRFGKAGTLRAEGEARFFPARARASVQLEAVALESAGPYVAEFLDLSLNRALVSAHLNGVYGRKTATNPIVEISGDLAVKDLAATEAGSGTDFIRWDEVGLKGLRIGLSPHRAGLDELRIQRLQTSLVMMTNGQLNVLALLRKSREAGEREAGVGVPDPPSVDGANATGAGATNAAPAAPGVAGKAPFWETWPVHLGKLSLQDVALFAGDELYGGGFRTQIESLDGEVRNVGLPSSQLAEVDLKGRLSANSGFEMKGTFNPDPSQFGADLRLTTHNADLKQFTPYTVRFAGYPVVDGHLTADVRYRVEDSRLEAANKVVLQNFTLGAKVPSPDAIDLPLKMGVALLKDSDGKIALDVPLQGTLNDPQFRVAPILWQAVRNILVKAVTAPFKLLGSLFGGGAEDELEYVEFQPGRSEIPESQSNRLVTLKRALAARPQLTLAIVPAFDAKRDARVVAAELLESRLRSLRVEEIGASGAPLPDTAGLVLSPEDRTRLVRLAYLRDFGALPEPSAGGIGNPAPATANPTNSPPATNVVVVEGAGAAGSGVDRPVASEGRVADPLEERLLETLRIPPERLVELAKRRGETVRVALADGGGLPPERLVIEDASPDVAGTGSTQVRFRLE